ncbi:hypothetical protein D3C87_2009970 [compost metagenome]
MLRSRSISTALKTSRPMKDVSFDFSQYSALATGRARSRNHGGSTAQIRMKSPWLE